jgi:predicted nucleic-acid-binding protein
MITSLDTNIVLRFLLDDIPEQTERATRLIKNSTVYVTDVVAIETVYVLEKVFGLSRNDVCELLLGFLGFNNVIHNTRFLTDTIELYRIHPALSIVDCYACEEAKSYGNELVALDKRLITQGGSHVKALR